MARSLTLKRFRPYVYRVNSCTCAYVDNILEHSVTLESPLIDTSVCCSLYVCVCVVRGDHTTAIVLAMLLATKPRIAQLMGSMTEVLWLCLAGERVFFFLFSKMPRSTLWPTEPSVAWTLRSLSQWIEWPGCDVDSFF